MEIKDIFQELEETETEFINNINKLIEAAQDN